MASSPPAAHDLDPAVFLQSVRELSEKREREDLERFQNLEQEVERSRKERAARRADRARCLSPEKTVAHSLSQPPVHANAGADSNVTLSSPPPPLSPSLPARQRAERSVAMAMDIPQADKTPAPSGEEVPEFAGFGAVKRSSNASTTSSATGANASPEPSSPAPSATSLARSGTLSWQRRPPSKLGGSSSSSSSSRPTSLLATDTAAVAHDASPDPSREQIAASLGSRDPSWFKQTPERGIGSAAYRKSNDAANTTPVASVKRGLPGMSRGSSAQSQPSPRASEDTKPDTSSGTSSIRQSVASSGSGSRYSTASAASNKPDLRSLIAADEVQQNAAPSSDRTSSTDGDRAGIGRPLSMSSSQARLAGAIDRPSSPTKGMGGFVQSAMMRRSDSQSKRWSAQQGPSTSGQNSSAASLHGHGGIQGSHSMPKLDATSNVESGNDLADPTTTPSTNDAHGFAKPALPHHSRSRSVVSSYSTSEDVTIPQSPGSPSKRWSPTKSSWIESALTRPDSPKPVTTRNSQPSWMADLAKAKAQRSSVENTSGEATPEVGTSRPASPTKTPFGQSMLKRSESQDLSKTGSLETSITTLKPFKPVDKFTSSPAGSPATVQTLPTRLHADKPEPTPAKKDPSAASIRRTDSPPAPKAGLSTPDSARSSSTSDSLLQKVGKNKPETPPKPASDFRSSLRSRPPSEVKHKEEPEFLSKFGNLRRTQQERYVAPDVLKDNILQGKSGLAVTGGFVKAPRRDELKESLLAKKDDIQKAKQEGRELPGQVHEKKASDVPQTPAKPEALAKRELLGRADSAKTVPTRHQEQQSTPEALARRKSLRQRDTTGQPSTTASFEPLDKQISAPAAMETKPVNETSKLAARFNPGLAGLLARGPPSNTPSRTSTPVSAGPDSQTSIRQESEASTDNAQLQDVRKDRARGPKRKKGGAKTESDAANEKSIVEAAVLPAPGPAVAPSPVVDTPITTPKPKALPGSAASIMRASLSKSTAAEPPAQNDQATKTPAKSEGLATKQPITSAKSPALTSESPPVSQKPSTLSQPAEASVPEFKGFGSSKTTKSIVKNDDDKENTDDASPSVKSTASMWGRKPPPLKIDPPPQIQLPTRREEALTGHGRDSASLSPTKAGLGIKFDGKISSSGTPSPSAALPPKPAKPSRVVSGQLTGAPPNKVSSSDGHPVLLKTFGALPQSSSSLLIDTQAVLASSHGPNDDDSSVVVKTLRKAVYVVDADGSAKTLAPPEDYTVFDELVYVCTHVYTNPRGVKAAQVFVWAGNEAAEVTVETAHSTAKQVAKQHASSPVQLIRQGQETAAFLHAFGGIFITRRGARHTATKQYMLCGRKHLGHIVFDEVDFDPASLCHGFVYLISYPITLQQTKVFLWKGQGCTPEESSAARLAMMDLGENSDVTEVHGGAEPAHFLDLFGPGTAPSDLPAVSDLWRSKMRAQHKFTTRLYRIQPPAEAPTSFMSGLWNRRPSWHSLSSTPAAATASSRSPSRAPEEIKVEARALAPFTQAQLDPDGVFLLDAYHRLYVLAGPLFALLQPARLRDTLLGQTLLFASDYAILSASMEDRPAVPKCQVLLAGAALPPELRVLFRHWDAGRGLWGTGGLMAGSSMHVGTGSHGEGMLPLEEVLREVISDV